MRKMQIELLNNTAAMWQTYRRRMVVSKSLIIFVMKLTTFSIRFAPKIELLKNTAAIWKAYGSV